jgi:hypothetical protein
VHHACIYHAIVLVWYCINALALNSEQCMNACQLCDGALATRRTDFTGRGELADRQQKLGQMLALLKKVGALQLLLEAPHYKSNISARYMM